ncbi:hypothetical protein MVI01_52090 [Myxococcus virescens]|uniref:Lipoprotein n=1 Tax=Myxococcus virescens TaxID=83456 RepID=A0A511HIZ4_9BACT|nr:hypothetical protein MVI01_52090 [Myxococcus virescens]SDE89242.1 hypothetical protein SAMN04488504_11469 [Myxococcus virescens]
MHRLLPLIVLFLVACGDKPGKPPPAEPGPSNAPIRGSLTVHSRLWEDIGDPSQLVGIYVLLGDGSRFRQPLGQDGVARFVDPDIQGPQDVTLLAVSTEKTFADTYLALEQPEVWLQQYTKEDTGGETGQATLKGRITGRTSVVQEVFVASADQQGHGNSTRAATDGSFEIDISGSGVMPVHLFAMEYVNSTRRFGLKSNITLQAGQTLDDVEIALDRAEDQFQQVSVENFEPYGTEALVTMDFKLGTMYLFRSMVTGAPPLQLPSMSLTPPFDLLRMVTTVTVGSDGAAGVTSASATVLTEGGSSPVVTIPPPLQLTSIPLGTMETPAVARTKGFTLAWNVAPTAQVVHAYLNAQSRDHQLLWRLTAPSHVTSFTPFELPAELTPVTRLPPGLASLSMWAKNNGADRAYADLFNQYEAPVQQGGTWSLSRQGYVRLVE